TTRHGPTTRFVSPPNAGHVAFRPTTRHPPTTRFVPPRSTHRRRASSRHAPPTGDPSRLTGSPRPGRDRPSAVAAGRGQVRGGLDDEAFGGAQPPPGGEMRPRRLLGACPRRFELGGGVFERAFGVGPRRLRLGERPLRGFDRRRSCRFAGCRALLILA